MRLEIPKWDGLQHFKKRDPIWIRLYRKLRHKREWRQASHGAAKLLVDLWLLASEGEELGVVDMSWADLSYETRENEEDLQKWVQELHSLGLITLISAGYQLEEKRQRREETETTAPASPTRSVENSGESIPTRAELREAARKLLGLGRISSQDDGANARILNDWLFSGSTKRDPIAILAAIEGAADMRDRDLIGWDSAKPGTPMTLKALLAAHTLDHTGDGAPRYLWDVAIEHRRRMDETKRTPTPKVKNQAMSPMADVLRRVAG